MTFTRSMRRAVTWLPVIAAFAVGCRDNAVTNPVNEEQVLPAAEQREIEAPSTGNLRSSSPVIPTCGSVVTYKLTDLRNTIGTVTVRNDAKNVYVTYDVTSKDWYISQTRLAVTRTLGKVPQDNKKMPLPWSFPNSTDHKPVVTNFTYVVPLTTVNAVAGDDIIVAAMAGVVTPKNKKNSSGKWDWSVMWGVGNVSGKDIATLHNYTVTRCADAPPPPAATGGVVTITFDDGYLTTYTNAFPVLKSLQLKGNVAVNPEPIDGGWLDYMTMANLKTLKGAGWSIVSHSYTHPDLMTLSPDSLEKELTNSQRWVKDNGFGPTSVFIVPFHSWDERERAAISKHYKYVRGYTVNQFFPALYQKWPITSPLDLSGFEPEYAQSGTAAAPGYTTSEGRRATMEIVERAVKEGEFVDIFFHRIPAEHVFGFTTLMTEIAKYRSNTRSWGEVVQ